MCRYVCNHLGGPLHHSLPRVDEDAAANARLYCRKANLIKITYNPGTYVIEQTIAGKMWNKSKVCTENLCVFDNLMGRTAYQYRTYRLTDHGISRPEILEFITLADDYKPKSVKNFMLDNITTDERYEHKLRADFSFEPTKDNVCDYYVRTWGGLHDLQHYTLRDVVNSQFFLYLDYGKFYDVNISAQNGDHMSDETMVRFSTPSCLDFHHNLNVCAPLKVEQLEATDMRKYGKLYDLTITWKEPELLPENYTVEVYQREEESSVNYEPTNVISLYNNTVPGNLTKIIVSDIELKVPYQVLITANSKGGVSPLRTITNKQFTDIDLNYNDKLTGLSIIIILAITLAGIVISCCCKVKKVQFPKKYKNFERYNQKNSLLKTIKEQDDKNAGSISQDIFQPSDKFQLNPSRLTVKHILGSGAYGVVRLGMLRDNYGNPIKVAVKTLRENSTLQEIKNFQQEIGIMKCAGRHVNIVSLIGYCTLPEGQALIVEYCCNGDLQTYLRKIWENALDFINDRRDQFIFDIGLSKNVESDHLNAINDIPAKTIGVINNQLYDVQQDIVESIESVSAADLLNFARQVATGMDYLSSNRIVHRDLAARNVLVCADKLIKISDFGLSRDIYLENMYKKRGNDKVPIKWMAIECLTHQLYTTHSDVWSFGILLWEIITLGGTPYPGKPSNKILKLLKCGYRLERPPNCSEELYDLMLSCWNVRPQCRPSFANLRQSLDKFLCDYFGSTYMNLTNVSDDSGDYERLFVKNNIYEDSVLSR